MSVYPSKVILKNERKGSPISATPIVNLKKKKKNQSKFFYKKIIPLIPFLFK